MLKASLLLCLFFAAGFAFADDLVWESPNGLIWSNFYTSPYYVTDKSVKPNSQLTLFCLDYNDEIAPPDEWDADITALSAGNVGSYQFGGSYPVAATPSATEFAFTGDADFTVLSTTPYQRYLEAAYLFTQIETAEKVNDSNAQYAEIVAQVAAWELFVDSAHLADLQSRISATGESPLGVPFQTELDADLQAAQTAVLTNNWTPTQAWSVVTGNPTDLPSGVRVQEFLTPISSVPEPASVALLLTVLGLAGIAIRRRRW